MSQQQEQKSQLETDIQDHLCAEQKLGGHYAWKTFENKVVNVSRLMNDNKKDIKE